MSTTVVPAHEHRMATGLLLAAIAALAFVLRLWPVLVGGGLKGEGDYDDGVYYAAAAGLVHGLLPYRDFVLLHPPGIVLVLAPFAALARWIGDPDAFATARVFFMIIGAANAVLVAVALRRLNLVAALVGGVTYAVYFPAVYAEHSTLLEPVATTCVLGAVVILTRPQRAGLPVWALILAGALLGASSAIKIWGVVPALAVLGWVLASRGWRRAGWLALGIVAGTTAICLPFYAAAPAQMWRMVVLAQLGRPGSTSDDADRALTLAGLTPLGSASGWWLAVAGAVVLLCCIAAALSPVGRLGVVLFVSTTAMLFWTPSWFEHYAAADAGGVALVAGAAVGWLAERLHRPAAGGLLAGVLAAGLLVGYAPPVEQRPYGQAFPTAQLAAAVRAAPGCVTTDDPISLIELDVLRRNLDRDCPLVADLGGYNYVLQIGTTDFRDRAKDPAWQRVALAYLRSGDVAVVGIRFQRGFGYSDATAAEIHDWPVRARAGSITVRVPGGQLSSS